jgi:uncharacterized membrane protein
MIHEIRALSLSLSLSLALFSLFFLPREKNRRRDRTTNQLDFRRAELSQRKYTRDMCH